MVWSRMNVTFNVMTASFHSIYSPFIIYCHLAVQHFRLLSPASADRNLSVQIAWILFSLRHAPSLLTFPMPHSSTRRAHACTNARFASKKPHSVAFKQTAISIPPHHTSLSYLAIFLQILYSRNLPFFLPNFMASCVTSVTMII